MILNMHSFYSLRYGTLAPEKLVALAARAGHKQLALTDINNSTGVWDFVAACKQESVKPVAGMEIREEHRLLYVLLARSWAGFEQINAFRTDLNLNELSAPMQAPEFSEVFVLYPLDNLPDKLRDNEFIAVRVWDLVKLHTGRFKALQHKMLALSSATFSGPNTRALNKHLCAVARNTLIDRLKPGDYAHESELLVSAQEWQQRFASHPELWQRSQSLMRVCHIDMDFKLSKNISCFGKSPLDDHSLLSELAYSGLQRRYPGKNEVARARVANELKVIFQLGFAAYYLMTWDMVRFAQSRGIHHVGRGSGANSIVAYCLGITDVDPVELNLYFERFINPQRATPPDFDIDFSWKDRNTIYDYLFDRYPKGHVALLGAINTFQHDSALRELAKCYGMPDSEIERLLEAPEQMAEADTLAQRIVGMAGLLPSVPNSRSIHAGGVLISDKPLSWYMALDLPPKGYPTAQIDMYIAEDIGFEKLDVLSQRGLGHIQEAVEMIRQRGEEIDIHQVEQFKTDARCHDLLRRSQTIGCFYIESPAMRGLLTKLRCSDYLTLVAASSIIRPGVARSGMMQEYIRRFHNPESVVYLHPVMREQLSETYGVMVYQEDVLKVCHHFAGLDLADADVLRRLMSGKPRFKDEAKKIVDKFFDNCRQRGYPELLTREVWRQIESFAGYSFSKAHSASYAVESFQSLYLRAYYPLEFITAVLNNFGGYYRAEIYLNEARRLGAKLHLPCINHSKNLNVLTDGTIYLGFVYVNNLETKLIERLVAEREQHGLYLGIANFIERVHPKLEQIKLLIQVGALAFVGYSKAKLLWEAHLLLHGTPPRQTDHPKLFQLAEPRFEIPDFGETPHQHAWDEIELMGFPITLSWFDLLKTPFRGELLAHQMLANVGRHVRMLGYLVTTKYVRTKNGKVMRFGTFLDAQGQFFDTTHFPEALEAYPFRGPGIYLVLGKLVEEFGQPSMEVEKMAAMPLRPRTHET